MTPNRALAELHETGKTGRFFMTAHAAQEASECGASRLDVQEALRTAFRATHQPDKDRWRVVGKDLDAADLTIVVVFDAGVVVVTVF
jgi:hypothetical protein